MREDSADSRTMTASCQEVLVLSGRCEKHAGGEGLEGIFGQVFSAEALRRASVRLIVTQLSLIWAGRRHLDPGARVYTKMRKFGAFGRDRSVDRFVHI